MVPTGKKGRPKKDPNAPVSDKEDARYARLQDQIDGLTKKIEELMKDGSDEAMIEAGKLLVSEILDNTQDNTGQLTEENENGN